MADGVGGWNEIGLSAKDFSNDLMNNCKKAIEQHESHETLDRSTPDHSNFSFHSKIKNLLSPVNILSQAHSKVEAKGSSTALVAVF